MIKYKWNYVIWCDFCDTVPGIDEHNIKKKKQKKFLTLVKISKTETIAKKKETKKTDPPTTALRVFDRCISTSKYRT